MFLYTPYVGKPCALFCSPIGKEQPILLSEKVMDGTSCGSQGLDICANGRCQVRWSERERTYMQKEGCGTPEQLPSVVESFALTFKRCGYCPDSTVSYTKSDLLCILGFGLDNLYYLLLVERL